MAESSAPLRIMVSRHSAFYSPLIATISAGFLGREGLDAVYSILSPGQRSHALIRDGAVDIMQSAVSSNWAAMEQGIGDLPVHFAQINCRDGFFLVARSVKREFAWKDLEGKVLLADHAPQPLAMLRYAAHYNSAGWNAIRTIDRGSPDSMAAAFRGGEGDYVHLQGPAAQQLEHDGVGSVAVSVGASMPPVAFSSLIASREFLTTPAASAFHRAYKMAREWAREAPPAEVAASEASFFEGISRAALEAAIARYQAIGCWAGDTAIPPGLYEQALDVFLYSGAITRRWDYERVVG